MQAPPSFVAELEREFLNTVRIRWSPVREEWHLEEKVGRAAVPARFVSEADDELVRERDGYAYVMTIRPGDRMPCTRCHLTLKVPVMETAQITCPRCERKAFAAYFPINHILLDHLRKIHKRRQDPHAAVRAVDARNAAIERSREADLADGLYGAVSGNWNALTERVSVGYTPQEFTV